MQSQGNVEKPRRGGSQWAGIVSQGNASCRRVEEARPRSLLGGTETSSSHKLLPRRGDGSTARPVLQHSTGAASLSAVSPAPSPGCFIPKTQLSLPFPLVSKLPCCSVQFFFFFKPYSPSWLSPFPGLSERNSWMVPQQTFQCVSSFLSLLHPGHCYLLLGEVVKKPREQLHRGVSTCPGVLHPPPGWVSAVVALGLQGRGSL